MPPFRWRGRHAIRPMVADAAVCRRRRRTGRPRAKRRPPTTPGPRRRMFAPIRSRRAPPLRESAQHEARSSRRPPTAGGDCGPFAGSCPGKRPTPRPVRAPPPASANRSASSTSPWRLGNSPPPRGRRSTPGADRPAEPARTHTARPRRSAEQSPDLARALPFAPEDSPRTGPTKAAVCGRQCAMEASYPLSLISGECGGGGFASRTGNAGKPNTCAPAPALPFGSRLNELGNRRSLRRCRPFLLDKLDALRVHLFRRRE